MVSILHSIQTRFLRAFEAIHTGSLEIQLPDGSRHSYGSGAPKASCEIHDSRTFQAFILRGDAGLGEAYARGWWHTSDLELITRVALLNHDVFKLSFIGAVLGRIVNTISHRLLRANSKAGSRRNIRAHYDISNAFYSHWLDRTMTYSSAIFADENESLEQAQIRKYDRLLSVLDQSGPRTLEIGCGWGGFAERSLQTTDRALTAVTISEAQYGYARNRLNALGLGGRADLRLEDYREITGQFDAIVSIEMLEAVGERYWPRFFKALKERLAPDGRIVLQVIIVEDHAFDEYRKTTDYIRQYIFPGGTLISPGKIDSCAGQVGLRVENMFRFGQDYARTLRIWSRMFDLRTEQFAAEGQSREFLRGWKFYLDTCTAAFEIGDRINVVQVELVHS